MDNITVHVLNFHGLFSHIELVLENTSTDPHTYYGINRWADPTNYWSVDGGLKEIIDMASSTFKFDIKADPAVITKEWNEYWKSTEDSASILGNNCAVAAQWFLTKFAGVPEANLSNLSGNHLALGIIWPSFIPCPVTLPGRVMSNVKFYKEAQNHPDEAAQYSKLWLYNGLAIGAVLFVASATGFGLAVGLAVGLLQLGLAAVAVAGCMASSHLFFKSYNILSAQNLNAEVKPVEPDTTEAVPSV